MATIADDERSVRRGPLGFVDTGGERSSLWERRGITLVTVDTYMTEDESTASPAPRTATPTPPRWWTVEFLVYYALALVVIPMMVYVPMRMSRPTNANYATFSRHLVLGWMGRPRDNSDIQYRIFREHVPMIGALVAAYGTLSVAVRGAARRAGLSDDARVRVRTAFLLVTGVVFVAAVHGTNALKLVALAGVNYALATAAAPRLPPRTAAGLVWAFNFGALVAVFWLDGVPYARISPALAWLDAYPGLLPRWYINYNFTTLRHISFAMDTLWATAGYSPVRHHADTSTEVRAPQETALTGLRPDAKERVRGHRAAAERTFVRYLAYLFYPPLFIAGPVLTFNDFAAQLQTPLRIRARTVATYAVRCAVDILAMEFMLHYMYVNAIKNARAWDGSSPMELSMIGFWNLMFMWLKLLIPWRVFRLWAALDGVDTPENMIRCMANNYSVLGFWRSWHRSFNLWVVRYIYVPIGGSRNLLPAVLLVFSFVAVWHDLSFTLLTWAWLITLFVAPELIATYLLPISVYGTRPWFRHACAVGAVGNVLMMMTANLVGFVVGVDGIHFLWAHLVQDWHGIRYFVVACFAMFVGIQFQFEYRAEELRRHILRKC
ncbi:glycerol transporter [Malassezia sp. CBS 17886]|nr:glycerol transporter [Malassezia sp. CBS 17886]